VKVSISFASTCPTCGEARIQNGYTRGTLMRLLELHLPIAGCCLMCDKVWLIHGQERDRAAQAVAASLGAVPAPANLRAGSSR
jgi:hypothetical protein